jgi:phosphoribosyl 1,2-cyclic phosphodiesterase
VILDVVATGSTGNCYVLAAGADRLILDCGVKWQDIQRGLGFTTGALSGCLATHSHNDHVKALRHVLRAGIDCYASRGTWDAVGISGHRKHVVSAGEGFTAGAFSVLPLEAQHDAAEPLAFLIRHDPTDETVLYATDTYYLRDTVKGVHYILIECNYVNEIAEERHADGSLIDSVYNRLMTSHMSLEHLKDFLAASDLTATRHIVLIHMSEGNSDEARMVREVQELTGIETTAAPRGGMRVYLPALPF